MIKEIDLFSLVENAILDDPVVDAKADITKLFRLLMNDEVFASQVKSVLLGFKKNRYQVSPYQETILKTTPKKIETLSKIITRLTKYVNNPSNKTKRDYQTTLNKLEDAISAKNEGEELLGKTKEEIDQLISHNEELNSQYLEQLLMIVQHSANRILTKNTVLDYEFKQRLENLLNSEDGSGETLSDFLDNAESDYQTAKERFSVLSDYGNGRTMVEQLYYNLPIYTLNDNFFKVLSKSPLKIGKSSQNGDTSLEAKLNSVKNEEQFLSLVPEIEEYLETTKLDPEKEGKIRDIMTRPFISRKGSPNSAIKIKNLMKTKLNESFDEYYEKMLQESLDFDEDDFQTDLMEVCALLEKKCDGPTEKTSSDRKGKKWSKCAKQPDGSYKRIHWGQEGVKVTGKSGDTKRKKSFRARHNCDKAKQGSARQAACNDW